MTEDALLLWALLGLLGPSATCPPSCSCTSSRISCTEPEPERSITTFPKLQSEADMDNITDIYIANQSSFSSINDKDLVFYRNLRNLTVVSSRLKYVSRLAFHNNSRLHYMNLKDNNLLSMSWRTVRHLNISSLLMAGNPLSCSCENLWLGEEPELRCLAEGGVRRILSTHTISDCVVPTVTLRPTKVKVLEGSNVTLTCNASGKPHPELTWIFNPDITDHQSTTSGLQTELHLFNLSYLYHGYTVGCSAENTAGQQQASLILDIQFPPKIKLMNVVSDHHWCIPFSVAGNPKPSLQWLFEGSPFNETSFITTRIHDITEPEYHGCLQLDTPTHFNNGRYTLLAINKYGQEQDSILAHFMSQPWDGTVSDPSYYDPVTDPTTDGPVDPRGDVAVYVVVGIAVVTFIGFILMLVILKFGRNSKFGIKGFVSI